MTPDNFDEFMPQPVRRRGPATRSILFAGVAGACVLGVGLGLWARPAMNERRMAVAAPEAPVKPVAPTRKLEIVVDDLPAPIGAPIEVLSKAPGGPSQIVRPGPPPEPEPQAPTRPPQGLMRVQATTVPTQVPNPRSNAALVPALAAPKLAIAKASPAPPIRVAKAEPAPAIPSRKADLAIAQAAKAHRIELARAEAAAHKAQLARAETAKAHKLELAKAAKAARQDQLRLAKAEAKGRAEARAEAKAEALAQARQEARSRTQLASLVHTLARAAHHKAKRAVNYRQRRFGAPGRAVVPGACGPVGAAARFGPDEGLDHAALHLPRRRRGPGLRRPEPRGRRPPARPRLPGRPRRRRARRPTSAPAAALARRALGRGPRGPLGGA